MSWNQVEAAFWAVLCVSATACSPTVHIGQREMSDANDTGRTLAAKTADDRLLLQRLPHLPSDRDAQVGGLRVVAEPAYQAASGRQCRALSIPSTRERRLACSDGERWFFVPDVFGASEPR